MIANHIDWEQAHEWVLEAAQEAGCTCSEEPEVRAENDDEDGIALFIAHEPDCHASRVKYAPLN